MKTIETVEFQSARKTSKSRLIAWLNEAAARQKNIK
jgi:hypothetical protein